MQNHFKFSCEHKKTFCCNFCTASYYYKHHLQRHKLFKETEGEGKFQMYMRKELLRKEEFDEAPEVEVFRGKSPLKFNHLPAHLALPMLLMRQNMLTLTKVKAEPDDCQPRVFCPDCGRAYKLKSSLRNHLKWECGKEPQFNCPYCSYKAKQKMHITRHIVRMHKVIDYSAVKREIDGFSSLKKETADDDRPQRNSSV
ncbi:hypothetical protein NQ318_006128 [Aromia moschata]|uniref:C2H2-type domain-containing protein n=1 Tax=Aromia moschata TaxID=1265417 RepID=A0AAV8Z2S9_9CUCU|nr:hypothetical protein NQ318_006128 [Aromia moschata]